MGDRYLPVNIASVGSSLSGYVVVVVVVVVVMVVVVVVVVIRLLAYMMPADQENTSTPHFDLVIVIVEGLLRHRGFW